MKPSVALLTTPVNPHNDNHLRLPEWFAQAGWSVHVYAHDALAWRDRVVHCSDRPAGNFKLIWPIGLGPRATFADRQELLAQLPPTACINAPASYTTLHGKSGWLEFAPPSCVASDAEALTEFARQQPGSWVLKPLAGSFGREVHRISAIQQIAALVRDAPPQYWLLQRFVDAIELGETRTLICADETIGSYLRRPEEGWQTNLARGARALPTRLEPSNQTLVDRVKERLRSHGVRFAAIDTVGGYVMEVNLANPGGLGTLCDLYGEQAVHQPMLRALRRLAR